MTREGFIRRARLQVSPIIRRWPEPIETWKFTRRRGIRRAKSMASFTQGCRPNALVLNWGSLCGNSLTLSRATMVLPKSLKPAAEQGATDREQMARARATPEHPGLF